MATNKANKLNKPGKNIKNTKAKPKPPKVAETEVLNKRGRLSSDEKKQIEFLCETKTDDEIAALLRRPVESVQLYRIEFLTNNPGLASKKTQNIQIRDELRNHHKWESIKQQFTSDEIIMFENSYVELMGQFASNILPTERNQIFQAITLEIFMYRHNRERVQTQEDIDQLKKLIEIQFGKKAPDQMTTSERQQMIEWQGQLNALRQTTQSKTKEFKDLSDKYSALLKELKGTREQRIQKVENSKERFTDVLRMLEEEDLRNRVGIDMEIMNKAVEKEGERLAEYHTYMDNEVDIPFLTPETMLKRAQEAKEAREAKGAANGAA